MEGPDGPDRAGYGILADRSPVLLWTIGPDGGDARFNATWLAFTGMTADQAGGNGWVTAVHPDDRGRRLETQREAAARGQPFEAEYRLRRHDGDWRWVLERGMPLGGADGDTYVGACFDVTERRREEQDLLRSREDLRLALAAGNMGTWVWHRRSGWVTRDRTLREFYGLEDEPESGTFADWVALVHPEDRERVLAEVERAVAEGGTYVLEHRVIRPDGEVRWVARRGAVFLDDTGEVAGTRGLVVDVTGRKRDEDERNRLLVAEQEARLEAEQAAGRLARLQAVTAGLADARTPQDVADVIIVQGAAALGADSGALSLLLDDGERLEVIRHVGYDLITVDRYHPISLDARLPASEALRTGAPVLMRSLDERHERFPSLRAQPTRNVSFAVVPLVVGVRRFGVIALGWRAPQAFDTHDTGFLTALGQQAAQALDRARYHEAEHEQARRQGFLAEASRLLGSSSDYEWALAEVVRRAVPDVADAWAVHLIENGTLRTAAAAAVAGDGDADADAGHDILAHLGDDPMCFGRAALLDLAAGGHHLLLPRVEERHRRDWATDDRHHALLEQLGARSALAVPLRSRDADIGVLVVATGPSGRRLGPDDIPFVEDVAARAAAAIANNRSHQARATIAHTLQQSLLPPDVPVLPGLDVAARYRPHSDDVEVGGDFYDVFGAGEGRWGVVIGDVSGKGVPAASLTALARHTVRTASRRPVGPSDVLDVLNNAILDDGPGERFCTVALVFLRYDERGVQFTLSSGGQPLPLLVDRDGDIRPVGRPGTAIGLFPGPSLTDVSTRLGPGETLVLYTDGVVEARSPSGKFADDLLETTLRAYAGRPAEVVADAIEHALIEFEGGRPRDDTAILVIRRPPEMFHEHFSPGPRAVPRARQRLRDWLGARLAGAPELAGDILMLTNELATNAARAARAAVDIHVTVTAEAVTVDVSDDGPGFGGRVLSLAEPPDDAVAGRGLHIVGRLTDESVVRSGSSGTLFRCTRYRSQPPKPGPAGPAGPAGDPDQA